MTAPMAGFGPMAWSPFPYGPIPSSGVISPFYVDLFNPQTVLGKKTWTDKATFSATSVTGLGNSLIQAAAAGNSMLFGVNAGNRHSLGAYSSGGQPFLGFWAYHGATANTLARSSGTVAPTAILGSSGGNGQLLAASVGAINSDISWTTAATWSTAGLSSTVALTVGTSGTAITQVRVYAQAIDPASVAALTTAEQTFTVTGLTTGDKVFVNKPTNTAGLGIVNVRVSAADTLAITFMNCTAAPIDAASETYTITAIRS